MSGRAQVIVLAVAGLVVAALLGLTASFLASDTIALPATSLAGGERLAPTATTAATTRTVATESTPTGTSDDHGGDDGSGRNRGRNRGRGVTRSGHGDHIDFSLLEAAGQILDPAMGMSGTASSGAGAGAAIVTQPRSRPNADLYPIFRCADGYVRVVMLSARQWRAMRNWLGDPGELADDALDSIFERFARADLIRRHVGALFADRTTAVVCAEGQAQADNHSSAQRP